MNIETKYKPGDKVFIMNRNKIEEVEIFQIKIHVRKDVSIKYVIIPYYSCDKKKYMEEECFSTKEDLMASL